MPLLNLFLSFIIIFFFFQFFISLSIITFRIYKNLNHFKKFQSTNTHIFFIYIGFIIIPLIGFIYLFIASSIYLFILIPLIVSFYFLATFNLKQINSFHFGIRFPLIWFKSRLLDLFFSPQIIMLVFIILLFIYLVL